MSLGIGILIIGSLYWDPASGRPRWRRRRLQMDRDWVVRAPIRYRRLSEKGKRKNTYTMVFDPPRDDQMGQARVVQCQRPVATSADLIAEAEWLWAAEENKVPCLSNSPQHRISAGWGCVVLLCNPQVQISAELTDGWAQRVASEGAATNKHLVSPSGLLQISWPDLVGGGPVPLDVLLATSTNPKPRDQYPDAVQVAKAWIAAKDASYFWENRMHGIHTFQDQAIEQLLNSPAQNRGINTPHSL